MDVPFTPRVVTWKIPVDGRALRGMRDTTSTVATARRDFQRFSEESHSRHTRPCPFGPWLWTVPCCTRPCPFEPWSGTVPVRGARARSAAEPLDEVKDLLGPRNVAHLER